MEADALFEAEMSQLLDERPPAAIAAADSDAAVRSVSAPAVGGPSGVGAPPSYQNWVAGSRGDGAVAGSKRPRTITGGHGRQLPPPSEEQRAVIDAVLSGHCVALPSVAGSGKTTCMLQVAASLPPGRTVTIITYNRALCDECKARVAECGLVGGGGRVRVRPYTIHGIVSRAAGRTVNDDAKLRQVVAEWDRGGMDAKAVRRAFGAMDLVLLDEVQDMRPMFYSALRHILRVFAASRPRARVGAAAAAATAGAEEPPSSSIQMCLVGDPNQMLYDFPTFGSDRASTRFMDRPEEHWGEFTGSRLWVRRRLTTSYRLTPNIASFVNAIWGTAITGGNDRVPNRPVEYILKFPFPDRNGNDDPDRLSTKFLDSLIRSNGPENVLLLAQSVKNENCPIRVHVNELSKLRDAAGRRLHNFHIKESARGFEGNSDVANKVRCWTFCASKGCEADIVVVFGLDMLNGGRVHALNQIGVALSRARKRLIVIHGMSYEGKKLTANPYYPLLGDSADGMASHEVGYGGSEVIRMSVPPVVDNKEALARRSDLTQTVLELFADAGILNIVSRNNSLPAKTSEKLAESKVVVYVASEFGFFAASEEARFLSYAAWTKVSGVTDRIDYKVAVQFQQTTEDVSALYGEALTYMLQWERDRFCPSIEAIVNDGILKMDPSYHYRENMVREQLNSMQCEKLSVEEERLFRGAFSGANRTAKGKDLIVFLNSRINLKKKKVVEGKTRYFPVRAIEAGGNNQDEIMEAYLAQIRTVYESASKTPGQWVYLANAVMAFSNYHEKWNQIGTDPNSYEWVEPEVLREGLLRLTDLMKKVDSSQDEGTFERDLLFDFPEECYICSPARSERVVGVQGICDWVGRGLQSPQGMLVDLLEIKFVSELSNMHRLQVLTYCALLAIERDGPCAGMIFNARTREMEVCRVEASVAKDFLLDIAQFKFNGERRQPIAKNEKEKVVFTLSDDDSSSSSDDSDIDTSKNNGEGSMDDPIVL